MASLKPTQILQLTPASEILFEGPFENVVTSYLELKNPSDKRVCFKVKTTAPKRYCVRPNSGIVEPEGKVKIAIMLQPIEHDSLTERSRHKFMVQTTVIQDDIRNPESVWHTARPEEIMDSKLRCIFQAPATGESFEIKSNIKELKQQEEEEQEPEEREPERRKAEEQNQQQQHHQQQKLLKIQQQPLQDLSTISTLTVGDDYKVVLISLLMLLVGVILGKYVL